MDDIDVYYGIIHLTIVDTSITYSFIHYFSYGYLGDAKLYFSSTISAASSFWTPSDGFSEEVSGVSVSSFFKSLGSVVSTLSLRYSSARTRSGHSLKIVCKTGHQ